MIPKIQIKKKVFFEILNLKKICMPKEITPKSQAKNKTLFTQYPFLTILTLKKYHVNKYTVFKF